MGDCGQFCWISLLLSGLISIFLLGTLGSSSSKSLLSPLFEPPSCCGEEGNVLLIAGVDIVKDTRAKADSKVFEWKFIKPLGDLKQNNN